jgi:SAM-dependent methyltransferase
MLNSASPSSTTPTIAEFSYSGTELDAVAEATNYYGWIIDSFGRAIGEHIVEAGAGIGTVSDLVLRRASPREMLLIEPAGNNIPELHRRFDNDKRVRIHHGYLEDIADTVAADTVIAVNVMEHVERDAEFLRAALLTLASGGALLLLVPAMPAIYGSLDRAFDHYRRYTRSGLEQSLLAAGFEIETLHYLNIVGVVAWFAAGRVFHRTTLGRPQVRFYDRWVIPWLRRIESRIHAPVGQSLLAIARKPAVATPRKAHES